VIPVALFAVCVLQPIEIVPVLISAVILLGLRTSHTRWLHIGFAAAGLLVFFLLSQRVGYAWTGERPIPRYIYAAVCGVAVIALAAPWIARARPWKIRALLCLFALWPFGFLSFGHVQITAHAQSALLVLSWVITAAFTWRAGILKICAVPLLTALVYHLVPEQTTFLIALAAHLGALVLIARWTTPAKQLAIAGVMFSLIYAMSPEVDILSVSLFCAALVFGSRAGGALRLTRIAPAKAHPDHPTGTELDDTSVVLLGAVLLAGTRYGILNCFGHLSGGLYALSNLDTHAGFATMSKDVALWIPASLVVWKMVCASTLVFALLFTRERFRRAEYRIVLVTLAIVAANLVEAALELGLSYGANEGRNSMSMIQVIFHGGILVNLAFGYVLYRLIVRKAKHA
jgi:hypothetical protein